MSHHHHVKQEKKKAVLARNRRNQMLFEAMRQRALDVERVEGLEQEKAPKRAESGAEDVLWSARTQQIKNRLTGSKRMATERWNRFSGTGDAGARGR